MSDQQTYQDYLKKKSEEHESLCRRCGCCCGVLDGDPCQHLVADGPNAYRCDIYENRIGLHKTKSGKEMKCVPIRDILFESWSGSENCIYKKLLKTRQTTPF